MDDGEPSDDPPVARPDREAALARMATARLEYRIPPLVATLRAAGVDPVLLKGPITRLRLYAADEVRETADVDLLVAPGDRRRAGRVLESLGFTRFDRAGHSDAWTKPGEAAVDLHVSLPFTAASPSAVWRALAPHVTTAPVAGHPLHALDEPAHLLHLAIHAAQNRFDPSARAFDEFGRAVAAAIEPDLAEARELADEIGVAEVLDLALAAVAEPSSGATLAARLPARKAGADAMWAFIRSPVHWRLRVRSVRRSATQFWSDRRLEAWLGERGRPVPPPGWHHRAAKVERLLAHLGHEGRQAVRRRRRS